MMSDYSEFLEDDEDIELVDEKPTLQEQKHKSQANKPKPTDSANESGIIVYRMPGRPPKSPKHLIRTSIRCLTTIGVKNAIEKGEAIHGLTTSNYLRLALYRMLQADGLLTVELQKDATWDELRQSGQV